MLGYGIRLGLAAASAAAIGFGLPFWSCVPFPSGFGCAAATAWPLS